MADLSKPWPITDTDRLAKNCSVALCEFLWERGFVIPVHGRLRDTLDAAMKQLPPKEPS